MEVVVERILKAIKKEEKILIFSDYDTDGIPGGAILYNFFKKIDYKKFVNFIPNRNRDGYGLTISAAEKIIQGRLFNDSNFKVEFEGRELEADSFTPDLIITIDCGIADFEAAQKIKEANIDLIITDHHLPQEKIPEAVAILNPKLEGEKYPEKNLCGSGVIFKLVQALVKKIQEEEIFEIRDG
jgi:single-stranded-DNA-specific exonuclease